VFAIVQSYADSTRRSSRPPCALKTPAHGSLVVIPAEMNEICGFREIQI
jgi:hypothetical protein